MARNASSSSRRVSSSSVRCAPSRSDSAHPQQAELEAQLEHVQRLGERLGRGAQLRCALAQHLGHHVRATTGNASSPVQRRRAVCGQLAEDLPGVAARLDRHLEPSPAIQRATAIVELQLIRSKRSLTIGSTSSARLRLRTSVSASTSSARSLQCLAQRADVLPEIRQGRWRRRQGRRRDGSYGFGSPICCHQHLLGAQGPPLEFARVPCGASSRNAGIPYTGSATGGDRFSAS